MNLDHHIAQLLYRYQCVTVPGFGAFLTEIQSAQLHLSSNSFSPPKKAVSFNFYLKNNDGLLANHVAQFEKISYEIAVQNIEKQVDNWKNALQTQQQIVLTNIGTILLNSENNLVFEPLNKINYHLPSFGLSTFVSPFIKRELVFESKETKLDTPVIALENNFEPKTNYLKYAAMIAFSLGTIGFFGHNYYQKQQLLETILVQKEVQKEVQNKIQEATFFIKSPLPNVTLTIKDTKMAYHIVAGAFRNEENAQRAFSGLLSKGFNARRIAKNNFGLYPVLFGSFATLAEAQKELVLIHKSENPEAWLLIKSI